MLPDLYAIFFAGGADPRPREESRTQSQGETPLIHERVLPTIPGKLPSRSERACYHEKADISAEPSTRSWRVARKEKNRIPDSIYKKGEAVWLSVEGKYGSFPVSIDSEGTWDYEEQQWKYQVRQTDRKLFENGKLVGENDLNRAQK